MSKSKSYFKSVLRWAVSLLVLCMIYFQLFEERNFEILYDEFRNSIQNSSYLYLVIPVLLVPLNVFIESEKYRLLVNSQQQGNLLTSRLALNQVLIGFMLSIIAPNGIGEFAGRAYQAETGEKFRSLVASAVGSISQWIVLICGGLIGSFYLFNVEDVFFSLSLFDIQFLAFCILLLLTIFYFRLDWIVDILKCGIKKILNIKMWSSSTTLQSWFENNQNVLDVAATINKHILLNALFLAFFRYAIYTLQLSLTFRFFGFNASWPIIFAGIAFIFLIQVIMPLPSITISLARVELGLLIWAQQEPNEISLIVGSLSIFILNIVIPSLLGIVVFSNFKVASRNEK